MTQPLESVYIEVVPDFSGFGRELRSSLRVEMARLEIELRRIGNDIERTMADVGRRAGDRLGREIQTGALVASRALDEVGDEAAEMGRDIVRGSLTGRNGLLQLTRSGILKQLIDGLASVGRAAGEALQVLVSKPVLVATGILVLVGAVTSLGAALADLVGFVGIIPSGFGVLLASIIPLIVAFQNFGDAVGALIEGDPDKIAEALAKMAPSAAVVAREIAGLIGPLRTLQKTVAEAFFAPLQGAFRNLATELLPTLTRGMSAVAGAFGQLGSRVAEFFAQPEQVEKLNNLFATTARIIDALTPSLIKFLDGFLKVGDTALPIFERLAVAALEGLAAFGDFIGEAAESGELNEFIGQAIDTAGELLNLFKEIGGLLLTIFDATDEDGRSFIETLTEMTKDLNEFFQSAAGQRTLEGLADAVGILVGALTVLGFLIASILVFLDAFGDAIAAVIAWAIDLGAKIRDLVAPVAEWKDAVIATVEEIPAKLAALAGKFLEAGKGLIKSFINGFRQAGNFIGDVAGDIAGHVKSGLNVFIRRINDGIGTLDNLLPFSLSRIPLLQGGGLARGPSMISEHGQEELALPLNDPRAQAAIRAAIGELPGGGPTINFGPGAINVNFDGVVPTPEQARQVGAGIGNGIADILARQGIRMNVRAI